MGLAGNKGEWSEIYTLFKLLADGVVYAGDGNMEKNDNLFYPILSVIRQEDGVYKYNPSQEDRMVIIYHGLTEIGRVSMQQFSVMANRLLDHIQAAKGASFELPDIESFMGEIDCHTLKARSADKTDIRIVIHDLRTGMKPELGFSIKSQLGHPATLLNSGKTTNIKYQIVGDPLITDSFINEFNNIDGQVDRMALLLEKGYRLKYHSMDCETFEDNLMMVDSMMPGILAECLTTYYNITAYDLKSITNSIIDRNPLGIRRPDIFYPSKIKSLLIDVALGMTPATVWTKKYDANGGYLVVKSDGDVLCYHFYDRNQLEDYLFNNTRFDFPSRKRYDYGHIFIEEGKAFIKLNFQIRFK